ncbi:MAG TPA: hypothetical protein VGO93_20375, partial [Candidatus Xenobia bacterium]
MLALLFWGIPSSTDVVVWWVSVVGCVLVARTRRHHVVLFLILGAVLGLPGLMLTVVATAFWTPPTRAQIRQLRMASVWARDAALADRLDDDIELKLQTGWPELVPLYQQACSTGNERRFLGRLEDYLRTEGTAWEDLSLYLLAAGLLSAGGIGILWLVSTVGLGQHDALEQFRTISHTTMGVWLDAVLPSVFYLALRSGRLPLGFSRLQTLQHQRHLASLAGMTLASGVVPDEVASFMQGCELTFDTTSVGWLAEAASGAESEQATFLEAERLAGRVRTAITRLWLA